MGLYDRLVSDIRNKSKNASSDLYYAEEPDWMIYEERKVEEPLNENKGIYADEDLKSINTAPSVFEKGTIFRTSEK